MDTGIARYPRYADAVLAAIPFLLGVGIALWGLLEVRLYVAMSGPSVLAAAVVVDAMYRNPPTD